MLPQCLTFAAIRPLVLTLLLFAVAPAAKAADGARIDAEVDIALDELVRQIPNAAALLQDAAGVLVFPNVVKGGFWLGGLYGEGALRENGLTTDYYNIAAASLGLQIGAQSFTHVIIFNTPESMGFLKNIEGFGIGGEANAAFGPYGLGGEITTNSVRAPVVSFQFGQTGLMAGVSIEGSKITRIDR